VGAAGARGALGATGALRTTYACATVRAPHAPVSPASLRQSTWYSRNSMNQGILFLTMIVTVGSIACGGKNDPTGPSPIPTPSSTVNYTAIGASDALGIGASVPCVPYDDCPSGRGYVHTTVRDLRARGFTVRLNNLGWPTSTISRRLQNLGLQYGREIFGNFMEQEVPFVLPDTTLFTIFTGANDVNVITSALGGGAGGTDRTGYINSQITAFAQDFSTLLQAVRERASSARIIVLNLPNMGAMPFLAQAPRDHRLAAQALSVGMTRTVFNPLTSSGVLVIDLMCDARAYQASTYSSDGFHPSDQGYAWIAVEVVAATTTTYKAPAASCAQMTLVQ
jgi:lysophospholipase L1-like esterase